MKQEAILMSGAPKLGVSLNETQAELFRRYYDLLERRNEEFNLTAIKGEEEAARLHFLDSLGILAAYDFAGKSVIDIGTGGGFPGWPMKIALPSVYITLVDSTEKKVKFLSEVSGELNLPAVCLHARAEELGADPAYREKYDAAVSRAVARLSILAELCLPLVKPGGAFIALKAKDSDEEISEALGAIKTLGGAEPEIFEYQIPETDLIRRAVIIKKERPTPKKYPRRYGAIKKSPIK